MSDIFVDLLKEAVERKFDRQPSSTKQFNSLSIEIENMLGETLSTSTLKRLWGYVSGTDTPRVSTLDVLSRYVGFADFRKFVESIKQSRGIQSDFCVGETLRAGEVSVGSTIELSWLPDRRVVIVYLGDFRWKVISNENSKLQTGSFVRFDIAVKGEPLYADVQLPGEEDYRPYIAGSTAGISFRSL